MKKTYKNIIAIAFLFVGLLVLLRLGAQIQTGEDPASMAAIEAPIHFLEQQRIAAPGLFNLNNSMVYAMLRTTVERVQENQVRVYYVRNLLFFVIGISAATLLIGFKSGLFAFLILGNQTPNLTISQIQIIHKIDGKKRKNYSN